MTISTTEGPELPQGHAHLVESLPGADAEEAMRLALDTVGPGCAACPTANLRRVAELTTM